VHGDPAQVVHGVELVPLAMARLLADRERLGEELRVGQLPNVVIGVLQPAGEEKGIAGPQDLQTEQDVQADDRRPPGDQRRGLVLRGLMDEPR
jgi:hypothetical protein